MKMQTSTQEERERMTQEDAANEIIVVAIIIN